MNGIFFRLPEAIAARDAMAKCLYGALFDWIVMQVNHALLSKKDTLREHQGHSIGMSHKNFVFFFLAYGFEVYMHTLWRPGVSNRKGAKDFLKKSTSIAFSLRCGVEISMS